MAGISSKALNNLPENKYKYNGIEKEDAFAIGIYDAQLRELDGQTGRWWQIDPKTENMEMWSPYASNYDNPITYMDFLGDEPESADGCCGALLNLVEDVLISASGVLNGAANTLSSGLISSDPFGMRDKLSGDKLDLYNNSVTVGKVGPLLMPGASSAKNPQVELVPVSPVKAIPVKIGPPPTVPIANTQSSSNYSGSNSSSNTNKITSQNQSKQSKVEKSTKTESVGNVKYTKTTEVRPSKKQPGQSRTEYIRVKNTNGKTIRSYKDSYDRANKFQHRKPTTGNPEGTRPVN